MLKIFINLYCKMHRSAKAINATCFKNLDSSIRGRSLKIDFGNFLLGGHEFLIADGANTMLIGHG